MVIQTVTTFTTTTRVMLEHPSPSTTTAMEQSPLTSPTRTQTRPTRSGRQPQRAATLQSSETERGAEEQEQEEEEEEGRLTHLTTTTTT